MALVPYLQEDTAPEASAAALARVRERRGFTSMVNEVLANSPSALDAFDGFSRHVNSESPLDKPLRELLILRMNQLTGNAYEWRRHIPIALEAGVSQATIEGLASWRTLPDLDARAQAALQYAEETVHGWSLTDDTREKMVAAYPPGEVVELVITVGWHMLVSTMIISLGLMADDAGNEPPLVPFVHG
jgi:4-carboxymuconolactone decarboxylase